MKNIAIVEDEDEAAARLAGYIDRYAEQSGQKYRVERFRNAVDFLAEYKSVYSVVFMDIQMPKMDGMSAAAELRKADKTVSIVFITNLIQYAQKGYEVDAVAYLLKPVEYYILIVWDVLSAAGLAVLAYFLAKKIKRYKNG